MLHQLEWLPSLFLLRLDHFAPLNALQAPHHIQRLPHHQFAVIFRILNLITWSALVQRLEKRPFIEEYFPTYLIMLLNLCLCKFPLTLGTIIQFNLLVLVRILISLGISLPRWFEFAKSDENTISVLCYLGHFMLRSRRMFLSHFYRFGRWFRKSA